jgi:hypothetical protein
MNPVAHKTRRISAALVLGLSMAAVAVPVAQADSVDRGIVVPRETGGVQVSPDAGALDPLIGDAIRAEQASPELDPLIADAIRAEQASPELDPLIADAIRVSEARSGAAKGQGHQPDFWNYDARTGKKTSNTSPGLRPSDLARLYSPTRDVSPDSRRVDFRAPNTLSPAPISASGDNGFQWDDAGLGAGAMLALVVMAAVLGTVVVRHRHGLLAGR